MHDFRMQQSDLARLCQDRELQTAEIHHANDFYGQASVLKRYAGLPETYALKGVLEHAPQHTNKMWERDREQILPMNFAISDQRGRHLEKLSGRPSIAIGFGFHYAVRLFQFLHPDATDLGQRQGTLVFPFHSTHLIKTEFDHADYAQRLLALPQQMQPVTVCIYWKDYLLGAHQPYQDAGMHVVTAGHMYDKDFLLRLFDICRQFEWAVSNEFGTQLFTSTVAGAKFFYVESAEIKRDIPLSERTHYHRADPEFQRTRELSKRLFSQPLSSITKQQRAYVNAVLGTEFVQTSRQLRQTIRTAEWNDRWRPVHFAHLESDSNGLPAYWQRSKTRSSKWVRSMHKRIPIRLGRKAA